MVAMHGVPGHYHHNSFPPYHCHLASLAVLIILHISAFLLTIVRICCRAHLSMALGLDDGLSVIAAAGGMVMGGILLLVGS